jgi:hypothetical protein
MRVGGTQIENLTVKASTGGLIGEEDNGGGGVLLMQYLAMIIGSCDGKCLG